MMVIPNIFPNSLGDKTHTQETMMYSCLFPLCLKIWLMDCRTGISGQWTNRLLRKWRLELGVRGWGVIGWMQVGEKGL